MLGVVLAMLGAGRLYAPSLQGRRALLLPAGALVYIAVPPARDFATSGLENGLVLAYLGLLWWMMVCWSQALRSRPADAPDGDAVSRTFAAALAFVGGLSVLVRPELALIGGLALVMMLIAARGWRRRVLIVVAGGAAAGGATRSSGWATTACWCPAPRWPRTPRVPSGRRASSTWPTSISPTCCGCPRCCWSALGAVLLATRSRPWWIRAPVAARVRVAGPHRAEPAGRGGLHGGQRSAAGDLLGPPGRRLHARPGAADAAVLPAGAGRGDPGGAAGRQPGSPARPAICWPAPPSVLWLAVAGWALWAANSPGMGADATRVTYSGIVDERRFYAQATGHAHPLTAADYLDYPRMRAVLTALNNTPDGALLLPSGNYDHWDVVPAIPPPPPPPDAPADWTDNGPHTVFFTNLGMLGMNVGLDVRVIDQIGLANPLAAHTARLEDGRIGHDKNLFPDWAVAEGPFLKTRPYIPPYLDEDWIAQAEAALKCPDTDVDADLGPRADGAAAVPVEPRARRPSSPGTASTGCRATNSPAAAWMCPSRSARLTLACRRRGREPCEIC